MSYSIIVWYFVNIFIYINVNKYIHILSKETYNSS